ncbi:putative Rossmann fold nucleotide-binding protein [Proteiniphilum saccharofermentans]|uniref:Cytokinin riboside 5'-monophosphate phosphoribohydrolase n=1 Tax=Proteiniphilum saccharofermentans TaxID=1642647 RepID=A0A1R3TBV1_9BACT|nr:TIGR00730 family Rossman fold protein [Proteiniphilum saccharofermentans]SCD21465.1 putative Rossmann fold nucleotide-binding protein [Proteiniphilum saccharofermentans]
MENGKKEVVVYCASSTEIGQLYFDVASALGKLLAENGYICINGAGKEGLMGVLNDAVLEHGGRVKGIIPRFMVDAGWGHSHLTETIVTETIHERKAAMVKTADAVIALPGGVGTLEELAEIITWRQLGLYRKPIIILNVNNYYQPLLSFFEKMISERFMRESYRQLWQVVTTPEEAVTLIRTIPDWNPGYTKYD